MEVSGIVGDRYVCGSVDVVIESMVYQDIQIYQYEWDKVKNEHYSGRGEGELGYRSAGGVIRHLSMTWSFCDKDSDDG